MNENEAINALINVIGTLFARLREVVAHYLQLYVFSKNPSLASKYGDFIIFMVTLTVLYALIEILEGFKKFFKVILALGWTLLAVLIALNYLVNR
ncbi:hypothetical protein [Ignicoccus hospitalis]|uniref:Uncharacterized protein n=1 Tax=Ignicoccus hospitalis (strain KIN4/I / DSM 18386 / JCM 14125) TaxID=453591 RepID=A8AAK1_IGNH4|nr:hypothetical protein [Ignicoccus hospitalis]ABU81953.1 hypothetical protein Igni_0771 [Ignicoccus hospitalis KIN4/I]HIH89888.1 hypothetical protein [Desulfurococcaceae archaeon]